MKADEAIPADAEHRKTMSVEFWRVGNQIFGRQLEGPQAGTLRAAEAAMAALEDLTAGERLPMLFDASTVGWMDAEARAYSRERIAAMLSRVAVIVSWENRQAHSYAFADVHRGTGVEMAVFTDRQAAQDYLMADTSV